MIVLNQPLQFASGPWELEVEPGRGGAVIALRHLGRDVLVSPGPRRQDAMATASFGLVPYANRIAHGQLAWDGRHWQLPRNFDDHPHPLHGTGWKQPWDVVGSDTAGIGMQLEHAADDRWPWAFTATQRIQLLDDAVQFELAARNTDARPMPVGLGFHPAFAANAGTRLRADVRDVWQIDADSLPVRRQAVDAVLPDLASGASVTRSRLVDHCFNGWQGRALIERAGSRGNIPLVEVTASPEMNFLQLYMPPGRDWFCAEPMSQMPDAAHHPDEADRGGWRALAPGESLAVWMRIAVLGD